jgi:4-aminobutyrate--pyruvate transaminase
LRQFSDHALVGEVRGIGLIGALEFVKDKATKEPFSAEEGVATKVMDRALDHGLITRAIGDSIAFSPPLIITTEQVDDLVARLGRTLDDVAQAMA